jgi:hypothetical protein
MDVNAKKQRRYRNDKNFVLSFFLTLIYNRNKRKKIKMFTGIFSHKKKKE